MRNLRVFVFFFVVAAVACFVLVNVFRTGGNGFLVVFALIIDYFKLILKLLDLCHNGLAALKKQVVALLQGGVTHLCPHRVLANIFNGHARAF